MQTEEFRKILHKFTTDPVSADPIEMVGQLQSKIDSAIKKATKLGFSGEEMRGVKRRFLIAAERNWMLARYPILNMEFADRKQRFLLARSFDGHGGIEMVGPANDETVAGKGQVVVSLPVFVSVWEEYEEMQRLFSVDNDSYHSRQFRQRCGRFEAYRDKGISHSRVDIGACVQMPSGITPAMFTRVRRALAYLQLFGVLLFDAGMADSGYDQHQVGVLWAPTDEAWSFRGEAPRPKGDPAILLKSGDVVYLLGYFDTPDEKPIANLIREFTEGPLANIE